VKARRGFSFAELLVVLTLLGLLVRIGLPRYNHLRKQAQSRAAVADVRVVRDAVLNYKQDRGTWPTETGAAQVPPGLMSYLPQGFDFDRSAYTLDYEFWPGGSDPTGGVIALAIDTSDAELAAQLRKLGASGLPHFVSGNRITFVFDGLGSIS
jgi:prepilin-type N-terminal cleavage/methylation domain-containing protein